MTPRFLLSLLLLLSVPLSAQPERQGENWHFGRAISVSFATGTPVLAPPSAMDAFEGVVSMSDANGQLLFYTNGGGQPAGNNQSPGIIWNRNHEVMHDMRGEEGGGFSARQSAIAMPDPAGEAGVYYLFTMEESEFDVGGAIPGQPNGRGLSYFIIDMNLNGGLGGVRLANQNVIDLVYEALSATPMASGEGFWIVCHSSNDDAPFIVVTPLTASGVGTPVVVPRPAGDVGGIIKFSPDGQFIWLDGSVFAFDAVTGTISENSSLDFPDVDPGSVTFTPDSRFLYGTQNFAALGEVIVRYDLSDGSRMDIARLERVPGETNQQNAGFQIGPNGNIYFVEESIDGPNGAEYGLSEIICVSSPDPTVNRFILDFEAFRDNNFSPQSLPNFVDAIFARPVVADTLVLDTATVYTCNQEPPLLNAREFGTDYQWSDGSNGASLLLQESGTYCVTITGGCQPTIDCQRAIIERGDVNPVEIELIDNGCEGFLCRIVLNADLPVDSVVVIGRGSIPNGILPPYYEETFFGDTIIAPKPRGIEGESIQAQIRNACGARTVFLDLEAEEDNRFAPRIDLLTEETLCTGVDLELEVFNPGSIAITDIRWFDGETDNPRTFIADPMEDYFATVFSECGDSTVVDFSGVVAEVCDCEAEVPEVITPNGDGVNDNFRLFTNCPPEDYSLVIYNRWGLKVFDSIDFNEGWDGTADGTPQEAGSYLYLMSYLFPGEEEPEVREGGFMLIR
ncbi:gliding motility-associated C-terminal domain-containing protein [Neolewinella agarilytica]|uniref:gliding motility-associated C-terminal domain-containing protein n=1 Tax=Neolewinella agarilytica TaxID=478744 RepID=UPI00235768F9|nr:gliding motility-associated C-terminal domain-containing protein [Neolewinella agarilytica]